MFVKNKFTVLVLGMKRVMNTMQSYGASSSQPVLYGGVGMDCIEVSALRLPAKYALNEKVNVRDMELQVTFYPYRSIITGAIPDTAFKTV